MQIVIDIPEDLYKANINGLNAEEVWNLRVAIKDGILLPKGHGRLIDADDLIRDRVENDNIVILANATPTIIEADKADVPDICVGKKE